jgi:polyphosphate kinase
MLDARQPTETRPHPPHSPEPDGVGTGSLRGVLPDAPPPGPARYRNRELAWLDFNERVLEEALDPTVPILERLKFLAIFSSNLDEFFMIRIAGLWRQVDAGVETPGPDGLPPKAVLQQLLRRLHKLVELQHRTFDAEIAPALAKSGVRIVAPEALDAVQKSYLRDHFERTILPVVTPLAIDPSHPFPHLSSKTICLAIALRTQGATETDALPTSELAIVHIPSAVIPRFLRLPSAPGSHVFISLEEAIRAHAGDLFHGYVVIGCNGLRVTRDSDILIDEENAGDLLKTIEEGVRARRNGMAVRLQYDARTPPWIPRLFAERLELTEDDLFPIEGMIAFSDLLQIYNEVDLPALKDPALNPQRVPALEREPSMFESIRRGDAMVHHPYQSFDYVVRFVREAAEDPQVLAIKMTLYRVGGASPIVDALKLAARNGKQVAVCMELKARFDEPTNIAFARTLEGAGAHVIYGIPGLKTHAKACLVVRREGAGVRRYCHLATGNYHARTALTYSDIGVFSARDDLCDDVANVFNLITGYCRPREFKRLAVAPMTLRSRIVALIRRERDHAAAGRKGRIVAKVNGLEDPEVIDELYAASAAGVEIDLIVRGICCLRPGVPGISERIRVRRIVDRFLEHARMFHFANGGAPEHYLSSADWMPRNLDRRVEVLFPVLDPALRKEIDQILAVQLADTVKARVIGPDGGSTRPAAPGGRDEGTRSQMVLLQAAQAVARGEAPAIPTALLP